MHDPVLPRFPTHQMQLATQRLRLRPLTEEDWPTILRWNQDPRVLRYSNDGDTRPWSMEMVQTVYRKIAEHAYIFVADLEIRPIGECWLQEMNLEPLLAVHPGQRIFRIDLAIGEPELWGRGLGTEIIGALVEFGFRSQGADALFGCHVRVSNVRSRRAFEKNGFHDWGPASGASEGEDGLLPRHMTLPRALWKPVRPEARDESPV